MYCLIKKILSYANVKFFLRVGETTLGLYLIQSLIVETIFHKFFHVPHEFAYFFCYIGSPIISIILVILWSYTIKIIEQRFPISSTLLFGSIQQKGCFTEDQFTFTQRLNENEEWDFRNTEG